MSGSKTASLADPDFRWDGRTSDLAQQYYRRFKAGDSLPQRKYTSIPSVVKERLKAAGTSFDKLPGLLQRALVWDSGFVENGRFDGSDGGTVELVGVKTLNGVSMADIAIPMSEYKTKCGVISCNGPGYDWYQTAYCNGTLAVAVSRCLVDLLTVEYHARPATWSIGGSDTMIPTMRLLKHDWIHYDGKTNFVVHAIHTAEAAIEPDFGRCVYDSTDLTKVGPGSLVVPCESSDTISSDRKSVMKDPKPTDLVTAWLQEYGPATVAPAASNSASSSASATSSPASPTEEESSSGVNTDGSINNGRNSSMAGGLTSGGVSSGSASNTSLSTDSSGSNTASDSSPTTRPPRKSTLDTSLTSPSAAPIQEQAGGTNTVVIVAPAFVVVLVALGLLLWCLRRRAKSISKEEETQAESDTYYGMTQTTETTTSTTFGTSSTKKDPYHDSSQLPTDSSVSYLSASTRYGTMLAAYKGVTESFLHDPKLSGKRIPYSQIELAKQVSHGAYGEVWVGYNKGEIVAIKRLLRTKKPTHHDVEAFGHEIRLSARLYHPNIVRFIGISWNRPEDLCMVMEFLPAGDLTKVLQDGGKQLTWSQHKLSMARGLISAVAYLHSQSPAIIHRDIKSKNVLLTNALEPKLIDFGVSRRKMDVTMTGGVGTPYWTAPEVLEGRRYTEKSDIYSLGVLLTELDTCQIPYYDVPNEEDCLLHLKILNEVVAGKLRPTVTDACPSMIREVVDSCLRLDPTQRPDAAEVLLMLV